MDDILRLEYACTPAEVKEAEGFLVRNRLGGGSKWLTRCVLLAALVLMLVTFYQRFEPPHRPYAFVLVAIVTTIILAIQRLRENRKKKASESAALVEITAQELRIAGESGWATLPWSTFGKLIESETLFVLPDRPGYNLFIFPKRVFPDERWCDWLREVADAATEATLSSETAERKSATTPSPAEPKSITLEFRLRCRDYLDRAPASWRTRGAMIVVAAIVLGASVAAAINPPPDAVFSGTQVLLFFVAPMLAGMELVVFLIFSVGAWLKHRRYSAFQAVTISAQGISWSQADGRGNVVWDARVRYKETPWSFIVWWTDSGIWLQLPKRAFPTIDGCAECREILAAHAAPSTWYLG